MMLMSLVLFLHLHALFSLPSSMRCAYCIPGLSALPFPFSYCLRGLGAGSLCLYLTEKPQRWNKPACKLWEALKRKALVVVQVALVKKGPPKSRATSCMSLSQVPDCHPGHAEPSHHWGTKGCRRVRKKSLESTDLPGCCEACCDKVCMSHVSSSQAW